MLFAGSGSLELAKPTKLEANEKESGHAQWPIQYLI